MSPAPAEHKRKMAPFVQDKPRIMALSDLDLDSSMKYGEASLPKTTKMSTFKSRKTEMT